MKSQEFLRNLFTKKTIVSGLKWESLYQSGGIFLVYKDTESLALCAESHESLPHKKPIVQSCAVLDARCRKLLINNVSGRNSGIAAHMRMSYWLKHGNESHFTESSFK